MLKRRYTRRRPYSKLGAGGVPSSVYTSRAHSSPGTAPARPATRYTWLGGGGLPTGYAPGSFAGRDVGTVTPVTFTVSNVEAITVATNAPSVNKGNVLVVTGVEFQPVTHHPTISRTANSVVLTNAAAITITGRLPSISQDNPSTTVLNPDFRTITVTALSPQIFSPTTLEFNSTTPIYISVRQPEIVPGVVGIQNLTQADIRAIWRGIKIDGYTPEELLKFMAAVLNGKVTGAGTGTEVFMSVDPNNQVPRVRSKTDSNGNRTSVELVQ